MWYYISDKKKNGPLSDAAMRNLYKRRTVTDETLVWTEGAKDWIKFDNTQLYRKITSKKKSQAYTSIKIATLCFRVMLGVFAMLYAFSIYFDEKWLAFSQSLDRDFATRTTIKLRALEFAISDRYISTTAFFIFLLLLYLGYYWVKRAALNAKKQNKRFPFKSTQAALIFFAPFINIITPPRVMSAILKSARSALKQTTSPFDTALIALWWFFNILAITVFIFDYYVFLKSGDSDILQARIIFAICSDVIILTAICLWILLVTRITRLQKRFFGKIR